MAPVEPTKVPALTEEPVITVAPTDIPEITEEPVATSTPVPTATPKPTATPWPMPSVSQINGGEKRTISFHIYKCGEKGEEVLALVKSLREENPNLYPNGLIELLTDEYDYSEQDILYGVYE